MVIQDEIVWLDVEVKIQEDERVATYTMLDI